ncbi:MAG: methyl-accepting chemotaxis protein, partial [Pseudomonadota bacterium]
VAALAGNAVLPFGLAAGCLSAAAIAMARWNTTTARIAIGVILAAQCLLPPAAATGTTFQVDLKALSVVTLPVLFLVREPRAFLAAAAFVVIQHLSMQPFAPHLVNPLESDANRFQRLMLHVSVFTTQGVLLWLVARQRRDLDAQILAKQAALEESIDVARAATKTAQTDRAEAEAAKAAAEEAQGRADAAREETEIEAAKAQEADRARRMIEARETAALSDVATRQALVVDALRNGLSALAAQDLSCPITDTFDEAHEPLREDYNAALEVLRNAISLVNTIAEDVSGHSVALDDLVGELTDRTREQAGTLQETTEAVSDISSRVRDTAEGARTVDLFVQDADAAAKEAGSIVGDAGRAMSDLRETADRISAIVEQVDEIAFQTNLLSLNAGIEAARAGDAGRGFAVVASEVGALARRSAAAAGEIRDLAQRSGERVTEGVDLVNGTSNALVDIAERVGRTRKAASKIAAAAGDQSTRLVEVEAAMRSLDAITGSNGTMVERSATASCALASSAQTLTEAMDAFSIDRAAGRKPGYHAA